MTVATIETINAILYAERLVHIIHMRVQRPHLISVSAAEGGGLG